jgi:hypothetical protein
MIGAQEAERQSLDRDFRRTRLAGAFLFGAGPHAGVACQYSQAVGSPALSLDFAGLRGAALG